MTTISTSQSERRNMKAIYFVLVTASLLSGTTAAIAQLADPAPAKPMKANYTIYSGDMGDEHAPSKTDRKLSIQVSGQAAKDIFDSIYPDAKVACSDEKGQRLREKGDLWCSYSPSGGYRCYIGYDLRAGKSMAGASC